MKYLLVGLIKMYQLVPSSWHSLCRYTPTCSEYAITSIKRFGCIKGSILALKRIFRCTPWGGIGYDPVPERIKNEK